MILRKTEQIIQKNDFKENRIDYYKKMFERIGLIQESLKGDINAVAPNFSFFMS